MDPKQENYKTADNDNNNSNNNHDDSKSSRKLEPLKKKILSCAHTVIVPRSTSGLDSIYSLFDSIYIDFKTYLFPSFDCALYNPKIYRRI